MQLASVIPKNQGHTLYFDNWFTSVNLLVELEKIGIHSLGTVRRNRIRGCVFSSENELKPKGAVYLRRRQTVPGNPAQQVERYDRKHKSFVQVRCPSVVPYYNSSMGGVDLVD